MRKAAEALLMWLFLAAMAVTGGYGVYIVLLGLAHGPMKELFASGALTAILYVAYMRMAAANGTPNP